MIWGGRRTLEEAAHRSNDERAAYGTCCGQRTLTGTRPERDKFGCGRVPKVTWSSESWSQQPEGRAWHRLAVFPATPPRSAVYFHPNPRYRSLLPRLPPSGVPAVVPEIRVQRLFATV